MSDQRVGVDYDDNDEEEKEVVDTRHLVKSLSYQQSLVGSNDRGGEFSWDPSLSSKEIHFSMDYRHAFLYESNYLFRTMIACQPFMEGCHYWEVIADARTEHELKIGVSVQ